MPYIEARSRTQPSRTGRFLLLSMLLHGLAVVALNLPLLPRQDVRPAPPREPIRVSFLRPERVEEPQQAQVVAEASSRAQSPEGPEAAVAKQTQTVLPKPVPTPAELPPPPPAPSPQPPAAQPPAREAAPSATSPPVKPPASHARRHERPKADTPPPRKAPAERGEPQRLAKAPEPAERAAPQPEVALTPPSPPAVESPPEPVPGRPTLFGRIPLLSGDDLEKYAQVRLSDQRGAFGDTVSLDTKELKYLSYFAHIKRKIERVWRYPPEAIASGLQGQLHLKFVLQRNGQVKTVELQRSSGWKVLDKEAWDAVLNAGPFNPFPPLIPEDELHITARFTYVLDEAMRRTRVR
jgi:protein TonB